MNPLKACFLIMGIILIIFIGNFVFISYQSKPLSTDSFKVVAPGHVTVFKSYLESESQAVQGNVFYIYYQKGAVLYFENFSIRSGSALSVFLSNDLTEHTGPKMGYLTLEKGNITYHIPTGTRVMDYSHILIWSDRGNNLVAYANISINN